MKKRLSIMAVAVLSSAGLGSRAAAIQPLEGVFAPDSGVESAARDGRVTCTNCVAGVRG